MHGNSRNENTQDIDGIEIVMRTKKELKVQICDAFKERLSAEGFKFRKWDDSFLRKEDDDITFLITLYYSTYPDCYGLDIIYGIHYERLISIERELSGREKPMRLVTGKFSQMIVPDKLRELGRNDFYTYDSDEEFNRKFDLIVDGIHKYGIPYLNMLSEKECTLQQMEKEGLYTYPQLLPLAYLLWCKDKKRCLDAAKDVLNFYAQYGTDTNEQYKEYYSFYERLKQFAEEYQE